MGGEVKRENSHTPDDMKYIKDCFQHALNNTGGWSYESGGASDEYRVCGTKSFSWLTPNGSASRATLQTLGLNKPPKDPILKASFMTVAASIEAPNDTAKRKNAEEAIKNVKVIHTPPEDDPEGKKFKAMAKDGMMEMDKMGEKMMGLTDAERQKIKQSAASAAKDAKTKLPLPQAEADALAAIIIAAGDKDLPLKASDTDITNDGRFTVTLSTNKSALPSGDKATPITVNAGDTVANLAQSNSTWTTTETANLKLKGTQAYDELKGVKEPSKEYLGIIGLNRKSLNKMQLRLVAAIETLVKKGITL